jgi:hypothetical protein
MTRFSVHFIVLEMIKREMNALVKWTQMVQSTHLSHEKQEIHVTLCILCYKDVLYSSIVVLCYKSEAYIK